MFKNVEEKAAFLMAQLAEAHEIAEKEAEKEAAKAKAKAKKAADKKAEGAE